MARDRTTWAAGAGGAGLVRGRLPAGKIGLEYRSRWWENDLRIYGGITETDLDLAHIWYPSHDFHARRGLVVGYYNTGQRPRLRALTPQQRVQRAVEQGVKIHGEKYRSELAHSFSVAWHTHPYMEGAWTSPAHRTPGYELLLRPPGGCTSPATGSPRGGLAARRLRLRPGRRQPLHQRVMSS